MVDTLQYLHPDVVAKLGSMELRARLVVEGFITGLHKSPFHGFSAEFSEHRQYRHGDDLKHIDWKIFGRTDRYYIKQYEDETNLRCVVAVDQSASMAYASDGNITKVQYASYLLIQRSRICRIGATFRELMRRRPSLRVFTRPASRRKSYQYVYRK